MLYLRIHLLDLNRWRLWTTLTGIGFWWQTRRLMGLSHCKLWYRGFLFRVRVPTCRRWGVKRRIWETARRPISAAVLYLWMQIWLCVRKWVWPWQWWRSAAQVVRSSSSWGIRAQAGLLNAVPAHELYPSHIGNDIGDFFRRYFVIRGWVLPCPMAWWLGLSGDTLLTLLLRLRVFENSGEVFRVCSIEDISGSIALQTITSNATIASACLISEFFTVF